MTVGKRYGQNLPPHRMTPGDIVVLAAEIKGVGDGQGGVVVKVRGRE